MKERKREEDIGYWILDIGYWVLEIGSGQPDGEEENQAQG